jgi:hypothetical protein
MTLGNGQQPLTRRQARELARQQEPNASTDQQPGTRKQRDESGQTEPPTYVPRSAVSDPAPPAPDRSSAANGTLSRRELRNLQAPEAGRTQQAEIDDDDGVDDAIEADAVEVVEVDTDDDTDDDTDANIQRPVVQQLHPPVGHWSVARDLDEGAADTQFQPLDRLIARDVASGGMPTTTNALILPSIPQQGNTSGPLTGTGEVLITGSIDLPRSLGSTGQHPDHFDTSEMDHMLDQLDEGAPTSNVAPVSASRAVSTHASTRNVMTPPKKHAVSLPTVLAIAAAVLAIGVLALFVGGYVFNIF